MNWHKKAFLEAWDLADSEFYAREPEQLFTDGAKWQRDKLRADEAVERVAGLFSGWIGCPECAYSHASICDRCKDFAEWAITALLGDN